MLGRFPAATPLAAAALSSASRAARDAASGVVIPGGGLGAAGIGLLTPVTIFGAARSGLLIPGEMFGAAGKGLLIAGGGGATPAAPIWLIGTLI